jgi:hypothetical protein
MAHKIIPLLKQEKYGKTEETYRITPHKISSDLFSLATSSMGTFPSNLIFQITERNKILIKVVFEAGKKEDAIAEFENDFAYLFNPVAHITPTPKYIISEGPDFMDVFLPINKLKILNEPRYEALLKNVKPLYPPITNSGVVRSQGDFIQKSKIVRDTYRLDCKGECLPVDGTGIKIGVISDSYDTQRYTKFNVPDPQIEPNKPKADIDVLNGDLPGKQNPNGNKMEVQVLQESSFQATDEGRAMLQIIHDVAPGAELFFHSASTPEEFKNAIEYLAKHGCSIIVDDLTFIEESFFGAKSYISKAINDFTNNDKNRNFYFSSAGNFGNYGYQDIFDCSENKPDSDSLGLKDITKVHVFGRDQNNEDIVFQKIEFDKEGIYMIVLQWDESKFEADDSQDLDIYLVDDEGRLLIGNNRFNRDGDTMEYLIFVVKERTSANILITSANGCPSKDLPFRYIVFRHNNGFSYDSMKERKTPTVSGHAMFEQTITVGAVKNNIGNVVPESRNYSSYGGRLTNNPPTSIDIDFAAPDGENINVALIGPVLNDDHFQNFHGTSASAPHAAGAFALMLGALDYCESDELPLNNIDVLQLFKDTCQNLGSPEAVGDGLINTEDAFQKLLADYPILNTSIVNNLEDPCEETTKKTVINIVADDISCEYGQAWDLTYYIIKIIDNQDEEIIDNQNNNLGLPTVKLKTTAVKPYPDVNNYRITPYFKGELNPEQIALFQINFIPGFLNIAKKDLVIKAKDKFNIKDRPINIEFVYKYDEIDIADNDLFLSTIKKEHGSTFHSNKNILVLIGGFIDSAENRGNIPPLPPADDVLYWLIETGGWMALMNDVTIDGLNQNLSTGNHIYEIEFKLFKEYLDFLKYEGDSSRFRPLSNNYKPLVNNYKPLVNNYKPLVNNYKPLVNNYKPLVNRYKPLVNTNSNDDGNDSIENPIHLILDDCFFDEVEEKLIYDHYSVNLITGLVSDEVHYVFPGAFFAHMSINFNISYDAGRYRIKRNNFWSWLKDFLFKW